MSSLERLLFQKQEYFCCGISVSYTTGLEKHLAFFGIWWVTSSAVFEGMGRGGRKYLLVLLWSQISAQRPCSICTITKHIPMASNILASLSCKLVQESQTIMAKSLSNTSEEKTRQVRLKGCFDTYCLETRHWILQLLLAGKEWRWRTQNEVSGVISNTPKVLLFFPRQF